MAEEIAKPCLVSALRPPPVLPLPIVHPVPVPLSLCTQLLHAAGASWMYLRVVTFRKALRVVRAALLLLASFVKSEQGALHFCFGLGSQNSAAWDWVVAQR